MKTDRPADVLAERFIADAFDEIMRSIRT
jgi:hypothetical protein